MLELTIYFQMFIKDSQWKSEYFVMQIFGREDAKILPYVWDVFMAVITYCYLLL